MSSHRTMPSRGGGSDTTTLAHHARGSRKPCQQCQDARRIRIGGAGCFSGGPLAGLLQAAEGPPASRSKGRARSVVLFYLFGGPSHIDTFDMKPHAPVEIRGEFRPIATSVPGVDICEHLPGLAAGCTGPASSGRFPTPITATIPMRSSPDRSAKTPSTIWEMRTPGGPTNLELAQSAITWAWAVTTSRVMSTYRPSPAIAKACTARGRTAGI